LVAHEVSLVLCTVTGTTVVETGTLLDTTTVLRAGQSVTESAQEVMVTSLVE
jgi:hypothetical protein